MHHSVRTMVEEHGETLGSWGTAFDSGPKNGSIDIPTEYTNTDQLTSANTNTLTAT